MIETEIKIKTTKEEIFKVETRLKALGAEYKGQERIADTYYKIPDGDTLRIRATSDLSKSYITFKGNPRSDGFIKSRKEIEVKVDNHYQAGYILEALDFERHLTIVKNRVTYELGLIKIFIDFFDTEVYYIEIESLYNKFESNDIINVAHLLGLTLKNVESKSYYELFKD